MKEIFEDSGTPFAEITKIHYFIDYETYSDGDDDVDPQGYSEATVPTYFIDILQVPQTFANKRKLVNKSTMDYSKSEVLTFDQLVDALNNIAKKKKMNY